MTKQFREAQIEFYINSIETAHLTTYKSEFIPITSKWYKRLSSKTFYHSFKNRAKRELSRPTKEGEG